MIDFKLAQELKDAGFPQKGKDSMSHELDVFVESDGSLCRGWNRIDSNACRVPTLEELIEACGTMHIVLRNDTLSVPWSVDGDHWDGNKFVGNGDTPAEAVARLWLALKKK